MLQKMTDLLISGPNASRISPLGGRLHTSLVTGPWKVIGCINNGILSVLQLLS